MQTVKGKIRQEPNLVALEDQGREYVPEASASVRGHCSGSLFDTVAAF